MKIAKWAFLAIASILYLLGTVGLTILWLDDQRDVWLALDVFAVSLNSFYVAMGAASLMLSGVFIYAFSARPSEDRQGFIVSTFPIVIGIGLLVATGVPVKAQSACGSKHSIAPTITAPVFLSDPYKRAPFLTYDFDESDRDWCDLR